MKNKAFIITGPTASGKSDFAHALAQRVGGVIINCDSVQIYRGIENISASPIAGHADFDGTIDGIPYMMFSILPLSEQISVADYQARARMAYADTIAMGRVPIFVGGTGYYINAIVNGIAPMPEIDDNVRRRAREMVNKDIDAARRMLNPDFTATDPQRTARALEVLLQTGRQITEYWAAPRIGAFMDTATKVVINPPAETLRARIAARIPTMIDGGAITEAQRIIDNNWDATRAIGAAQLCAYLRGEITRDECIQNWVTATNQYAKRQRTWFRTQFHADITINRITTDADIDTLATRP